MISRKTIAIAGAAGLAALAAWVVATNAQQGAAVRGAVPIDGRLSLGKAAVYRNLAVFPIYDSSAKAGNEYITLDEGLKAGVVKVKESKDGGTVNTLYVSNSGMKPLYIMAGEVVLGGQQDRTLGRDQIVSAGKKDVPVTVFCVEHGRWSGRSEFGESAPSVAGKDIRAYAMVGEFDAEKSQIAARARASAAPASSAPGQVSERASQAQSRVNRLSRMAGDDSGDHVAKAQQQVWDGVAAKNAKLKIENATGTYRDALTMKAGDAQASMPAYVKSLSGALGSDPHLVGVVAAVNGKVIAADSFSDPALFHKLWPKLLRSYAADAVEQASDTAGAARAKSPISARDVKTFIVNAKNDRSKEENVTAEGRIRRYESKDAAVYGLIPEKGGAAGAKPLHESVISK
jgi:hypothetical protein